MKLRFPGTKYSDLELPDGAPLAVHLTSLNSPVMFGCRTGLCGTCVVEIRGGIAPPPDGDEQEILELHAPDPDKARLACQVRLSGDVELRCP